MKRCNDNFCIACEKRMYGECSNQNPSAKHAEDFEHACDAQIEVMKDQQGKKKRRVTIVVGPNVGRIVDLDAAIRSLEAKHGIDLSVKIQTVEPVKSNLPKDNWFPLFSEIVAAAGPTSPEFERHPYKQTQNNDWRGNGKQRSRRR